MHACRVETHHGGVDARSAGSSPRKDSLNSSLNTGWPFSSILSRTEMRGGAEYISGCKHKASMQYL